MGVEASLQASPCWARMMVLGPQTNSALAGHIKDLLLHVYFPPLASQLTCHLQGVWAKGLGSASSGITKGSSGSVEVYGIPKYFKNQRMTQERTQREQLIFKTTLLMYDLYTIKCTHFNTIQ